FADDLFRDRRCQGGARSLQTEAGGAFQSALANQSRAYVLPTMTLNPSETLPSDGYAGALAGRIWRPDVEGPSVVAIRAEGVFDITEDFPTMRDLCETPDPAAGLKVAAGERVGTLAEILSNTPPDQRDTSKPWLLAPIDLQAIKAAGVTFAISMIERVIEE